MRKNIIEINNVQKIFNDTSGETTALSNVNLTIQEGEFAVVIGPSGCGKSTLLYQLAGFDKPSSGEILLKGKKITGPAPDRGFVFQDYALFAWRTVLGNILFGLQQNGWEKDEARERALDLIKLVHLEGFENAYPHTLSGGMKQRVGIARALAYNPDVLLMDEPFGALDAQTRKIMQQELVQIWESARKTVMFVTHSVIEAVYLADKVIVMTARPGRVKGIISIDLPRPRDYTGEHFLRFREEVLSLLQDELQTIK